jgi:hypothetical protein
MDELPKWVNKLLSETKFVRHNGHQLFGTKKDSYIDADFSVPLGWGLEDRPLTISTPERAILEALLDVPERLSFEHANQLFQGLLTLSPNRLYKLLEDCTNVKVKRLFLWLAEKNERPWMKIKKQPSADKRSWIGMRKIDFGQFSMESGSLGSGKRMLVKGGKLDPKYLITVPPEMLR